MIFIEIEVLQYIMRKVYAFIIVFVAIIFTGYFYGQQSNNVIDKVLTSDVNHDGNLDEILLYYNDEQVLLKINDATTVIMKVDNREQVFANNSSDHYSCELNVNGSSVVVGVTYAYTNKYGSTSWINSYTYESNEIKKVWSSDDLLKKTIHIDHYDKEKKIIYVKCDNVIKEMVLDDVSEKTFMKYTTFLLDNDSELEMNFRINPEYKIIESGNTKNDNLIIRTVTAFGACPINDIYISIYELTSEGIVEVDSFFSSFDKERALSLFDL